MVSGRVQGVYFRAFTKKQALKHNITGLVSNNDDGTVEIFAQAEQKNLDRLINWCHKGPLLAKVESVTVNEYLTKEKFSLFEIR